MNPWIKGQALPPGTYRLKLPKGSASRFQEAYRRGQLVDNEGGQKEAEEVKKGKGEKKK